MVLIDVNGVPHELTSLHVHVMLGVGWTAFLLAWVFNILHYRLHPFAVDFNIGRLKNKFFFYIFGKRVFLCKATTSKGRLFLYSVCYVYVKYQNYFNLVGSSEAEEKKGRRRTFQMDENGNNEAIYNVELTPLYSEI